MTQLLSKNAKTGVSIDFPIKHHCRPSKICMTYCYARFGHQAMRNARNKQIKVSEYLKGKDISDLILEAKLYSTVRLCGSGDMLKEHVSNIIKLAKECPYTQFWGMTRKKEIAYALNGKGKYPKMSNLRILLTVDATSPQSVWNYEGAMCFGPRRPEDTVPNDDRIITVFPRHQGGRVIKGIPEHPKDCQAVYHRISGCLECGRCWSWDNITELSRVSRP